MKKYFLLFVGLYFSLNAISQSKVVIKQIYSKGDSLPQLYVANFLDSCLQRINDSTVEFKYSISEPIYIHIYFNINVRPRLGTFIWLFPNDKDKEVVINYSNKTATLTNPTEWDIFCDKYGLLEDMGKFDEAYTLISTYIENNPDSFLSLWLFTHSHALYIAQPSIKLAIFNKLTPKLKDYSEYRTVKASLLERKYPNIGDQFKEFSLDEINGKTFNTNEIKNKWILLTFWSNNCIPCIKELDTMSAFNNSIDTSKAKIISISLDEDKNKWVNSKYNTKIKWTSLWQMGGFNGELSLNYNVYSMPFFILFNQEKKLFVIKDGANELEAIRSIFRENHLLK
jgi:alkyl hydroperoxide reductase subunit AhpC